MQPLSGLDAAWLYLESELTPMHLGGIYLFEMLNRRPPINFEIFREHLAGRLDVARILRQRLIEVPLHLGTPYWIDDPDFSLDAHLTRHTLAQPGDWPTLMSLAEDFFSRPLDRERPLWEMAFVEGVGAIEPAHHRCVALLVKAHHTAVDGLSGAEMIWALLDPTPTPAWQCVTRPWLVEAAPSAVSLLLRTVAGLPGESLNLARRVGQVATGAVNVVLEKVLHRTALPPLPLTAPTTCLNHPLTGRQRTLRSVSLPLESLQAIRRRLPGATINDVVLTICAGALRRYLLAHHDLPEQPLVAAVPIALRSHEHWQAQGNQVSAMLVPLATHESEPLQRFRWIRDRAQDAKRYTRLLQPELLAEMLPAVFSYLLNSLSRRLYQAQQLSPLFNLFITHVPGPRQPLYLHGAPLIRYLGMAPIYHGMGLILVVTSYLETLTISLTSSPEIMPDPEVFTAAIEESFAELAKLTATR
ncbi:MAG: wax ester/triacylglycerol synthase family O-acyltransferase [Candidatus Competibacteraceae bacterium]